MDHCTGAKPQIIELSMDSSLDGFHDHPLCVDEIKRTEEATAQCWITKDANGIANLGILVCKKYAAMGTVDEDAYVRDIVLKVQLDVGSIDVFVAVRIECVVCGRGEDSVVTSGTVDDMNIGEDDSLIDEKPRSSANQIAFVVVARDEYGGFADILIDILGNGCWDVCAQEHHDGGCHSV